MLKNRNIVETEIKNQVFLSFRLVDELFAANVDSVVNILELIQITPVPLSPPHMIGVLNQRGTVLPVIDTRLKLNLPITENTKDTCIIVLSVKVDEDIVEIGAIADAVNEVIEVPEYEIFPPIQLGSVYDSKYIKGLIKYNAQFVNILDIDAL